MKHYFRISVLALFLALSCGQSPAQAAMGTDVGYISRGVVKTTKGVLSIPRNIIQDSSRMMFPFGLVTGTVKGTFETVGYVVGGAFDMVRGALPYAKYLTLL